MYLLVNLLIKLNVVQHLRAHAPWKFIDAPGVASPS